MDTPSRLRYWLQGWVALAHHRDIPGYSALGRLQRFRLDGLALGRAALDPGSGFALLVALALLLAVLLLIWKLDLAGWRRDLLLCLPCAVVAPWAANGRRRHIERLLSRESATVRPAGRENAPPRSPLARRLGRTEAQWCNGRMKRMFKIVIGLVVGLLLLAIGLAAAVAILFDANEFQPLLAQSVEKATGRTLQVDGDLGLSLFPCCSVRVGQATLGNPPGFFDDHFLSVDHAELSIRIWPFLTRRQIEIGMVRLEGLDARLVVDKNGAGNWSFETDAAGSDDDAKTTDGGAAASRDFRISGLRIRDGQVSYRDERGDAFWQADDLQLETGGVGPGTPFDLRLVTHFSETSTQLDGKFDLRSTARLDIDALHLQLDRPVIDLRLSGEPVPAESLRGELSAAEASLEAGEGEDLRLQLSGFEGTVTMPGLQAPAGDLTSSFAAPGLEWQMGDDSKLQLPSLNAGLEIRGREIPGGSMTGKLSVSGLVLDMDRMNAVIENFRLTAKGVGAELVATGGGRLSDDGSDLAGSFELEPLSPRELLAALGEPAPDTADPAVLRHLAGKAGWKLGKDSLELSALDASLDDTRLAGSLSLRDFDKPRFRFNLEADQLDLDRYLAPETEKTGIGGPGGGDDPAAADELPLEMLRGLRLDGDLGIGELRLAGLVLEDVSVSLKADGGRLRFDPLAAALYGGEYLGAVSINVTGNRARISLDQQLDAVQVGALLSDFNDTDQLTGALSGQVRVSGTGNTAEAILASLDGDASLSLADGVYLGVDLWHEISKARARIKREELPPAPDEPGTPLNAMELAGTLTGGVFRSTRLLAEIPHIRLGGNGSVDLVQQHMEWALRAEVFEAPVLADGRERSDLKGLAIPLKVSGPLDDPGVSVDLKDLAAGAATQKLKDRLLKKLGGDDDATDAGPDQLIDGEADGEAPDAEDPTSREKRRDLLKKGLRDILK